MIYMEFEQTYYFFCFNVASCSVKEACWLGFLQTVGARHLIYDVVLFSKGLPGFSAPHVSMF